MGVDGLLRLRAEEALVWLATASVAPEIQVQALNVLTNIALSGGRGARAVAKVSPVLVRHLAFVGSLADSAAPVLSETALAQVSYLLASLVNRAEGLEVLVADRIGSVLVRTLFFVLDRVQQTAGGTPSSDAVATVQRLREVISRLSDADPTVRAEMDAFLARTAAIARAS